MSTAAISKSKVKKNAKRIALQSAWSAASTHANSTLDAHSARSAKLHIPRIKRAKFQPASPYAKRKRKTQTLQPIPKVTLWSQSEAEDKTKAPQKRQTENAAKTSLAIQPSESPGDLETTKSLKSTESYKSTSKIQLPAIEPPQAKEKPATSGLSNATKAANEFVPFLTSLIDTVKVVIAVPHRLLARYAESNSNARLHGIKLCVTNPETGAVATVFSCANRQKLLIEFSIPKFLTGQNIVGCETIDILTLTCIKKVCALMGLVVPRATRRRISQGHYRLTRVDAVAHIDCRTSQRATEVMFALRGLLVGKAKDISFYDDNTIYIGQHSRRRTLKLYRKDIEVALHPLPSKVHGRAHLVRETEGLIRVELVLRREELADHALDRAAVWNGEVIRKLLDRWFRRLCLVQGMTPDVALASKLSPILATRFNAWLVGDAGAFTRGVAKETARRHRRDVLKVTGIDVARPLTTAEQAAAVKTVSSVIAAGFGYRSHDHKWKALTNAVATGSGEEKKDEKNAAFAVGKKKTVAKDETNATISKPFNTNAKTSGKPKTKTKVKNNALKKSKE
jgi:hypothetical protein